MRSRTVLRAWARAGWPAAAVIAAAVLAPATSPGTGWAAQLPSAHAAGPGGGAPGPVKPVRPCASLVGVDFSRAGGGTGKVTSATVVKDRLASGDVAFCDVRGVFAPRTRFGMKLPVATWHGQYVQEGCGGFCGAVPLSDFPPAGFTCAAAGNGQLALAADDMGHTGAPTDASWARDSLRLRVVFGLTSEHSLARMARAVLTAYYGRPAAFTYYDGCSTGGREALMLAQRYPGDFDGILAGAPAGNLAPLALFNAWMVASNTGPGGHQILASEKIPALHAAVLRACANAQHVITDPRRCGFDPASIRCPPGTDTRSCLTPAQVRAVRAFYRGPSDRRGDSLYNGGQPYGSELGWPGEFVAPAADQAAPGDTGDAALALGYLKDMAFVRNPPDSFTLAQVRFTGHLFRRLNLLGDAIYNANSPRLRAFAAHGGKLILYHGWADPAIPPWSTLDYYKAVERAAGGFGAAQAFSRLYLIPGAYHCLLAPDGTSVNLADFLTALTGWVQDGAAPGTIEADTYSISQGKITVHQWVRPYDALARVVPARGSLNGHYRYLGHYHDGPGGDRQSLTARVGP